MPKRQLLEAGCGVRRDVGARVAHPNLHNDQDEVGENCSPILFGEAFPDPEVSGNRRSRDHMTAQITATVSQISPSASQGRVRQHAVLCDRPVEKGGEDQGPMGGEMLLMGLGGCFIEQPAGRRQGARCAGVQPECRGHRLLADAPSRFSEIDCGSAATFRIGTS